jgi:hypothetical protein
MKRAELKARAYYLAKQIAGRTISQPKHLKKWLHQGLGREYQWNRKPG